ncbi:MAG: methyl-accepting chemotaxis protein [Treponema sp.]|jgi:methyl-accepting chemotaxis protein|nr:methyl-accepting chemotaxis protein [Treponema sp.]
MKLKFRLSGIVIGILLAVVAGLSITLLRRASAAITALSIESATRLAARQAEYWKGREEGHIRMLRTLANIMSDYELLPGEQRRSTYNNMLYGTLTSETNLISVYTVWKPNAIDGMDERYAGVDGQTARGQYAMNYAREGGRLTFRTTTDVEGAMAYINGPKNKTPRIEDPVPRNVEGKNTFVVRMMVPIINPNTNETVGGVGCVFRIDLVQSAVEQVIKDNDDVSVMVIYTNNSCILGSYQPDRIGKLLTETDSIINQSKPNAVLRALETGETLQAKLFSPVFKTNLQFTVVPFAIADAGIRWAVMVGTDETKMLKEVGSMTRFTIAAGVIAAALIAAVLYFLLDRTTKPIVLVAATLKDISGGEGDLTRRIPIHSKDEIGDLAEHFNLTLEKIRALVAAIKKQAAALFDIGAELAGNMTESAAAVNEITANIQNIKTRVINQSAGVTETNATMEQITVNINKLSGHVERQSASVAQSSSAIEEMLANIQSVTGTLVRNTDNVRELMEASEVGRSGLQEVAGDIQEIARESEGLLEINAVMENIASQTNLLSMNAAIEAAHAGEAGKGFAVVADEIRKLAESSGEQSKTISAVLKKIKGSIDKISRSTDNVLGKFEAIESGVKTVAEQEENIRNAMDEQGAGSKQILDAIGQVNEITEQVKSGSAEMLEGSKEVIQESRNLEKVTQEITGGMNEMASGADQINAAVSRVNDLTGQNRDAIDLLTREVSRFKIE